jgi:predicted deacetylase
MTQTQTIRVISGSPKPNTWGGRHLLAWRQLSVLWHIPSVPFVTAQLPEPSEPALAYSIAIAPGEYQDASKLAHYYGVTPTTSFLNAFSLRLADAREELVLRPQQRSQPRHAYEHVFSIQTGSPLTEGLPGKIVLPGPAPAITPVSVAQGMQVLVSLDGIPIVVYRAPHLLVGADAWQFGVPTVPMLYAILSNWLSFAVGCSPAKRPPRALIRLDDLPTTAENQMKHPATSRFDRKRARTIRRLACFAEKAGVTFTLMYSSHCYGPDYKLQRIADIMPRSIREFASSVKRGVFEVGSHGMVHLRHPPSEAKDRDPREFLGLDEAETETHLQACESEIRRCFNTQASGFVAPAWGYRPSITKRIAARHYNAIIDSSHHMEDGSCDVLLAGDSEGGYINLTETFRTGHRMMDYANPDFWKCYAIAGLPVHYMQHTDTNWHLVRTLTKREIEMTLSNSRLWSRFIKQMDNVQHPLWTRAISAALLVALCIAREPRASVYFWRVLTRSSLYAFVQAMRKAGYQCVGLSEFSSALHPDSTISHPRNRDARDQTASLK